LAQIPKKSYAFLRLRNFQVLEIGVLISRLSEQPNVRLSEHIGLFANCVTDCFSGK